MTVYSVPEKYERKQRNEVDKAHAQAQKLFNSLHNGMWHHATQLLTSHHKNMPI